MFIWYVRIYSYVGMEGFLKKQKYFRRKQKESNIACKLIRKLDFLASRFITSWLCLFYRSSPIQLVFS